MASLEGLRLLITRPAAQAKAWALHLQGLGAQTFQIPVLALAPLTEQEQIQAIKNRVLDFDLYQKAIFVSQNAVDFGLQWLEDYWPQLPLGVEYFAVGETTARALAARGLTVQALNAASSGAMNSESLLAVPELQQLAGEKVLIFRGLGGRGHMAEMLRARGAEVHYCEVYQRSLPPESAQQLASFFEQYSFGLEAGPLVLAMHSGESLANFVQALSLPEAIPKVNLDYLRTLPLLVPGERVANIAREQGFTQTITADNATDSAMTQALIEYFNG